MTPLLAAANEAAQADVVEFIHRITIGQIFGWLGGILFILSWVIQISPIKLNPWTKIAKAIGRSVNQEVICMIESCKCKMDILEVDIQGVRNAISEERAIDARRNILHFGDNLIHYPEREYSKERYDEVLASITLYEQYCKAHPEFLNHITESTVRYILKRYNDCLEHGFKTLA